MSTFAQIRTYCALRFRDPANSIVSDTDWKSYVNDTYEEMLSQCNSFAWNENSTTLSFGPSVRSVALPTDAWQVTAVWDQTNQFPMIPLEGRDQVYSEYPQQTEVGQAMHYRIFNNTLQVYPLPQSTTVYLVEYIKMPADLVADIDVPVFPVQWHTTIVAGAVALAYIDDGNTQQAAAYKAEYEDEMMKLVAWINQPRQARFYEPVDTFM